MRELKIKGIYQHFKGDYYLVEDIGIHSESGEKCVIYRSLYGDMTIYIDLMITLWNQLINKNILMLNKLINLN